LISWLSSKITSYLEQFKFSKLLDFHYNLQFPSPICNITSWST